MTTSMMDEQTEQTEEVEKRATTDPTGWECRECAGTIAKDTDECPHCGANPLTKAVCDGIVVFGFAISLTGIGAIVGIPAALIAGIARFGVPKRLAVESDDDDGETERTP